MLISHAKSEYQSTCNICFLLLSSLRSGYLILSQKGLSKASAVLNVVLTHTKNWIWGIFFDYIVNIAKRMASKRNHKIKHVYEVTLENFSQLFDIP
jgi:hypothetical protein